MSGHSSAWCLAMNRSRVRSWPSSVDQRIDERAVRAGGEQEPARRGHARIVPRSHGSGTAAGRDAVTSTRPSRWSGPGSTCAQSCGWRSSSFMRHPLLVGEARLVRQRTQHPEPGESPPAPASPAPHGSRPAPTTSRDRSAARSCRPTARADRCRRRACRRGCRSRRTRRAPRGGESRIMNTRSLVQTAPSVIPIAGPSTHTRPPLPVSAASQERARREEQDPAQHQLRSAPLDERDRRSNRAERRGEHRVPTTSSLSRSEKSPTPLHVDASCTRCTVAMAST